MDAAHLALLRDDWRLAPEAVSIAWRTVRVVTVNIGFTALYNVVSLSLAVVDILPPILAAAQSPPDLGILANSSRHLRQLVRSAGDSWIVIIRLLSACCRYS